jgi:hypothetical protein
MKTVKKKTNNENYEYRRVDDKEADRLVGLGWSFCPKTEWKVNVRDFGKIKEDSSSKDDKYKKNKNPKNAKASKI